LILKYPIEVKPYEDETLISWIIRTSFTNGTDPIGLSYALFGSDILLKRDFDRYINEKYKIKLTKATRIEDNKISSMQLNSYINKYIKNFQLNKTTNYSWLHNITKRGKTVFNGFYFCSECFKESPHLKLEWRLSILKGCTIHKIDLTNHCCSCNTIYDPRNNLYNKNKISLCSKCGYDLSKTPLKKILDSDDEINIQSVLEKRLNKNIHSREEYGFVNNINTQEKVNQLYLELISEP